MVVAGLLLIAYAAVMYLARRQSAPTRLYRLAAPALFTILGVAMLVAEVSNVISGLLVVLAGGGAVVVLISTR